MLGERAGTRADFNDGIIRCDLGSICNVAEDVLVAEKVLAECLSRSNHDAKVLKFGLSLKRTAGGGVAKQCHRS